MVCLSWRDGTSVLVVSSVVFVGITSSLVKSVWLGCPESYYGAIFLFKRVWGVYLVQQPCYAIFWGLG